MNKAAAALGKKGGRARAKKLTPEQRSEIARQGGIARQEKARAKRKASESATEFDKKFKW